MLCYFGLDYWQLDDSNKLIPRDEEKMFQKEDRIMSILGVNSMYWVLEIIQFVAKLRI